MPGFTRIEKSEAFAAFSGDGVVGFEGDENGALPHHGSIRNISEDMLKPVTADHYVISAKGLMGD